MNKLKEMLAKFIDLAADELGNNGCNDVDESFYDGWSVEERQEFVKEFHDWNGNPQDYDPEYLDLPDFAIMRFLKDKILEDF